MALENSEGCEDIIRRATLDDMDTLLSICRGSFPLSIRWQSLRSLGEQWWRVVLESRAAETWVCLFNGEVAGFVVIILDSAEWAAERKKRRGNLVICLCGLAAGYKLILPKILKKIHLAKGASRDAARLVHIRAKTGKTFWIELIAVAPHMRGRGLAKNMLRFCESRAVELRRPKIGLRVDPANKAARKLYERLGFICIKEKASGYFYTKMLGMRSQQQKQLF